MQSPANKVEMAELKKAVRKVFAFKPPPKPKQSKKSSQSIEEFEQEKTKFRPSS